MCKVALGGGGACPHLPVLFPPMIRNYTSPSSELSGGPTSYQTFSLNFVSVPTFGRDQNTMGGYVIFNLDFNVVLLQLCVENVVYYDSNDWAVSKTV